MFRRGFKDNVKNEMIRDLHFIEKFKIMIEIIIDLNDKLYKRVMKKRYVEPHLERKENYINFRAYKKKLETRNQRQDRLNETISMKLNIVLSKKFKNKKKQIQRKKNSTCYACDKESHYAKNCKSKNVVWRQFNVTLKKQFKTQNMKD